MKKIKDVVALPPYDLEVTFESGQKIIVSIEGMMASPTFEPLKNPIHFKSLKNRSYFIEWPDWEIDLSADTLWHIGKMKENTSPQITSSLP